MKELIRAVLPDKIVEYLRDKRKIARNNIELSKLSKFDTQRFKSSAYDLKKDQSFTNLRAKITLHYHSIEKGLSNPNFRYGFGENAFTQLFWALEKYIENDYPVNEPRFQQALSVIESYIKLHDNQNFEINHVKDKYKKFNKYYDNEYKEIGGATSIKRNQLPNFEELPFDKLAKNRHSIRDFGKNKISEQEIFEAIQIATKSPSVCNRQAVKVHLINSPSLIKEAITIQGGFRGNGKNLQKLLLVTANKEYMSGAHERNQTYIDGGIFLMSLVYALTFKGIASCILNTDFVFTKEIALRELMNIEEGEDFIAFIAVGSYPDILKIANSPRDSYENITEIYD